MRRLLIGAGVLAGLVILLLAALWVAPLFTDWTSRRDQLAEIASARIGRTVSLHGPVRLRLLPYPVVEAEDVILAPPDAPRGHSLAFSASSLRLRVDGVALLLGRIAPREVEIVGAELRLPWPPAEAVYLPYDLSGFSAELVDSRIIIGGVRLENVQARLTAGDILQGLHAEGRFAWGGLEWRFDTHLGRPGYDGYTPLGISLSMGNASLAARGVLTPEGTMEGSVEASGPDLSLLVPGPPGAFRARGRITVRADLLAVDDLALDIGGSPARGALTLRLSPSPRLDAALVAGRLDLDPWLAALRARRAGLPLGLDLSAEAATFRGIPLRRLRAAVSRDAERLTLSDVSALLPGNTSIELNGATAGDRLEAALRFSGTDLRGTVDALGFGADWLAPNRFREGEGRARLVLEPGSIAIPELTATLDGARVSGAGVLRFGARPALGLGLTLDTLDLQDWLRPGLDWPTASRLLGGIDANIRLAAEQARWRGVTLQRASLDAALENGRLTLRRLAGQIGGADLSASGTAMLGATPRLSDTTLEIATANARALAALLPGNWPDGTRLANEPVTFRATANGTPEALAVQTSAEIGDARVEASGTLDLPGRRGSGNLTLRHPGAPRLIFDAFGIATADWIDQGSLSLVASLAAGPQGIAAERFELVAGALRASGQLALSLDARPRLTGRIAAETVTLPPIAWRSREPLPVAALRAADAEIALSASRLEPAGLPPLRDLRTRLRLNGGILALDEVEATIDNGALRGSTSLDASGDTPRLTLAATLRDATITGPLLGLPLDIISGEAEAEAQLAASGSSPGALLATLGGEAALTVRRGTLTGLDAAAAGRAAAVGEDAALRAALREGETSFENLSLRATMAAGRATLTQGTASGEDVALTLRGEVDIARGALDLTATEKPADPTPEVGIRITGPVSQPRRVLDLSAWLRWRAER
ncbi:AsmA family protein [Roseomonas xinghualingensis]|uniref:AsmA family protein n=1 Tax=Roseomonas xinghualingensis TaxID=2986475 RepID=UPI0021F0AD52|nr:AsmA family protein [Roseomonas sp. SXEYE001]MCV4207423.1 AsmA family protein [Roseomonas sp. SXEYE001]